MRKTRSLFPSLAVTLAFVAAACGGQTTPGDPNVEEARSTKQRVTSPQVQSPDLDTQVRSNNAFAFDLYHQLQKNAGHNLFYSPYSISSALAMVQAGARGATETQSAKAMHYVLPQGQLHPVFNKVDLELKTRGQGKKGSDQKPFRLKVVNAIWGQRDYHFEAPYLDTIAQSYGAGLRLMNFITQPDPSRLVINQWVEDQTESRIKDLLPPNSITSDTRLVLTNAIYFNASWAKPFNTDNTKDGSFTLLNDSTITVPMMKSSESATAYRDTTDFTAVTLPYDGNELSML
ncbi:MAG: serpin family protein, partial [Deltaproteobacteria bacterium]|nr:serpin family protein [Deltaproteobacteria bacterium]